MDAFVIHGGQPLRGTVRVSGAKNSALKLAAAALLTEGRVALRNVPVIADMEAMARVLAHLGVRTVWAGDELTLDVPAEVGDSTPEHLVRQLRASIIVLGPLLARCGRARVAMPGGCDLGNRGIDLHLAGLARLGAEITYGSDYVEARTAGLRGAEIELPYASVGATENLLLAAVTAEGRTVIRNAAREPEIGDLALMLRGMGARIEGIGSPTLEIEGVGELRPVAHRVVGDRIEAGTYAVGAAVTGGEVRIEGVVPAHLRLVLDKLRATGAAVEEHEDGFSVDAGAGAGGRPRSPGGAAVTGAAGSLSATDIVTLPFPGFPTDMQPQFLVLLSQATGTSMVTENVFDGRFSIVEQLRRMGAEIEIEAHHAIVRGATPLRGALVRATDLRAGAALVLAGLVAEGETVVAEPQHVDRGYQDFAERLRALGGDVARATLADEPAAVGAA